MPTGAWQRRPDMCDIVELVVGSIDTRTPDGADSTAAWRLGSIMQPGDCDVHYGMKATYAHAITW